MSKKGKKAKMNERLFTVVSAASVVVFDMVGAIRDGRPLDLNNKERAETLWLLVRALDQFLNAAENHDEDAKRLGEAVREFLNGRA